MREGQGKRRTEKLQFGECFRTELFSTFLGSLLLVRSSYGEQPFTPGLPWPEHRFYVNRLYHAPQTNYVDSFGQ